MDGQALRKDVGKQKTWQPGLEFRWWVELSALVFDNGYRRIRQRYRDRKAADISVIEECVRRILPLNYYQVDQELMRRKVKLIYEIIGDIARVEAKTTSLELTSDHENRRSDISDKCSRPCLSVFQADECYLFFDSIYSTLYDTTPRRYFTSFAITRDFFQSFFGTAENDLDRQLFFRLLRDNNNWHREESSRIRSGDSEQLLADQGLSTSSKARLLPDLTGIFVENTHTATILFTT
ncbi:hypothetical protein B0O99DRAFT_695313 [Bisporella sp. PMI_857]|nr:hypothetical protein B0O99DRAFT_695313 [Bisporella sp. PMI_857]